ncbi:hypothetical protein GCM10010964_27030 [Caldovatus sediminis]|uniref:Uncharacterized protein n=1 Tax=Caldovatus sediminis TaxID=2041189 RepID=A0A8J2ZCT9_9PROT|nr:hypothetical protein GCM10010964_27030 [Caldovatus sediminis]
MLTFEVTVTDMALACARESLSDDATDPRDGNGMVQAADPLPPGGLPGSVTPPYTVRARPALKA